MSRYKVLASSPSSGLSWLELQPLTDGPHQISRHCAHQLKAPILGDTRWVGGWVGGVLRDHVLSDCVLCA